MKDLNNLTRELKDLRRAAGSEIRKMFRALEELDRIRNRTILLLSRHDLDVSLLDSYKRTFRGLASQIESSKGLMSLLDRYVSDVQALQDRQRRQSHETTLQEVDSLLEEHTDILKSLFDSYTSQDN